MTPNIRMVQVQHAVATGDVDQVMMLAKQGLSILACVEIHPHLVPVKSSQITGPARIQLKLGVCHVAAGCINRSESRRAQ